MRVKYYLTFLLSATTFVVAAQDSGRPFERTTEVVSTPTGDIYGSLMLPFGDSASTIVLMVAGSGPTDRDGNQMMMRNNSYRMLATALADHNIASLRFDKRGIGASRNANIGERNVRFTTFVDDVKAWVAQLRRDGRFRKIILLGHSEGALVSTVAVNEGAKVNALISLSGGGRTMDQVLKDQLSEQPPQIRNIAYNIIDSLKGGYDVHHVPFFLAAIFRPSVQPYIRSLMELNPQAEIRRVRVPILIIQGDADIQVGVEDARLLHAANPASRLIVIAGMNHVLKDCPFNDRALQLATYSNPAIPINRDMVDDIVSFIKNL